MVSYGIRWYRGEMLILRIIIVIATGMQEVMIHIRKIAVVQVFVCVFFSYSFGGMGDVEKIKECILTYNRIVMEESKRERHTDVRTFVRMMEDIATARIAQKLYIWIQSWHENGLFMDSEIKKIDFIKIKLGKDKAVALTEEWWKYKYIDKRINKIVHPETDVFYRVEYHLSKRKDGKWLITKIKVLEEKQSQEGKK